MNQYCCGTNSMTIVVAGPSGAGKHTVLDRVMKNDPRLVCSVSATTREPRSGEEDGRDYQFMSRQDFIARVEADEFIEYAEVHGELYGTLKKELERLRGLDCDPILELDVQGAAAARSLCSPVVMIFVAPPRFNVLEDRLARRGSEDSETVAIRLETARREMKRLNEFDYIVVNDELDEAVTDMEAIIRAERCRVERHHVNVHEGDCRT